MKKQDIKQNLLLGIGSGAMTGLIFLLGDGFSDLAADNGLSGGWLFLIKVIIDGIGIVILFNRIEKRFK